MLSKTKTDFKNERESDKTKLLKGDKKEDSLLSDTQNEVNSITPILSSNTVPKYTNGETSLHNHMNTNVFNSPDTLKGFLTSKTQILVEIDASKQSGFSPSPLIFTTAKIHTSDKTKHMEPLQVTPVPILSTIEVSIKGEKNSSGEPSGSVTSNVSTVPANISKSNKNISEKSQNLKTSTFVPEITSKIVENKDFSDEIKLTQNNRAITNEPAIVKDLKIGPKLPSKSLKDASFRDGNYVNNKEKNDMNGKPTKISLCQDLGSSTLNEIKSTIPSAVSKSMNTPVTVQASSTNNDIKQIPNTQTTEQQKINILTTSLPETDLNKNVTSRDKCAPSQSNKSVVNQDKTSSTASTSNKHLQRQKYAIDKEDTKSQCTDNNPSPPTSKIIKSGPKIQSPTNDVNSTNDKKILPKSTANDKHVTSPISNKLPSENVTSANKNAILNSVKPTISPHNIPSLAAKTPIAKNTDIPTTLAAQNETIAKPSPNNVTVSGKSTGSTSKLETSLITNKPVTAVTSSTKMTNVPIVDIPKTSPNQSATKTNITNIPSTTSNKLIETNIKNPSPPKSTSNTKVPPVSKTIAKTLSSPTRTINSASVSTISAKTSPVSITDTKNASLPATSATISKPKTTTVPTTATNTPSLTITTKSSTGIQITSKASPISTTTAKGTSASITSDKISNTPTTSNVSQQVTSSSVLTSVSQASTDSTTKALQPHKRSQELTNGNKTLNG